MEMVPSLEVRDQVNAWCHAATLKIIHFDAISNAKVQNENDSSHKTQVFQCSSFLSFGSSRNPSKVQRSRLTMQGGLKPTPAAAMPVMTGAGWEMYLSCSIIKYDTCTWTCLHWCYKLLHHHTLFKSRFEHFAHWTRRETALSVGFVAMECAFKCKNLYQLSHQVKWYDIINYILYRKHV